MKKRLILVVCFLVIITFIANGVSAISEELEIYDKMLRLHILANSDSDEDQELKLKVRDAVLKEIESPLSDCANRDEAENTINNMKNSLIKTAEKVIFECGYDYSVTLEIVSEYYPTREYDGISLPNGVYRSVKIQIGESDGQNWWCVLFPQVCTGTAKPSETLAEVGFTANQIRLLTDKEDTEYVVKFKILEVISSIFN